MRTRGGQKIPKFCGHHICMAPKRILNRLLIQLSSDCVLNCQNSWKCKYKTNEGNLTLFVSPFQVCWWWESWTDPISLISSMQQTTIIIGPFERKDEWGGCCFTAVSVHGLRREREDIKLKLETAALWREQRGNHTNYVTADFLCALGSICPISFVNVFCTLICNEAKAQT